MSRLSSGLFGRRRSEPQHSPQKWNHPSSYQDQYHHGSEVARQSTPPHVAFPSEPSSPPVVNSHIEWKDTPEAYVYKAHLPAGLKRSDVRVEVDDDRVLCIICERSVEKEEQRGGWHRVEVSSGHFIQRLMLPENSKVDQVKAHMDNGVLTIHVPKHRVVNLNNHCVRNVQISHV